MHLNTKLPRFAAKLFVPGRYKVFYGGRGAGRSWSFALVLLLIGAQRKLTILCCREFQKSIADSVHKLLQDQISRNKLPGWRIQKKTIEHVGTGTVFLFEGLRFNTNRIKSLEGIDFCWVEEAESVSKESWDILIPTIRKHGSEIWVSFNPYLITDPTYERFVINRDRLPPGSIVEKVGWQDNPWFYETTMPEEKDYLYAIDPEAADHVWGGAPWAASDAQIFAKKCRKEAFEPKPGWVGPLFGADFGFANDPNVGLELYINKDKTRARVSPGRLMIRRESWRVKLDINKIPGEFSSVFGPRIGLRTIRADSARPETISFLKQHGLPRMIPCYKWPGSIEDGIDYIKHFEEIVIHPECEHTWEESRLYSYKVDKDTKEVLKIVVDKHNNTWDAARYALQTMIRSRKNPGGGYSGTAYAS